MAFVVQDRVKDTTTTTGTGTITITGTAPTGFVAFASAMSVSDTFYYSIVGSGSEWEVGYGTLATSTTISRSVIASSNSNALVSFSAGTKDVFLTLPASNTVTTSTAGLANVKKLNVTDNTPTSATEAGRFEVNVNSALAGAGVNGLAISVSEDSARTQTSAYNALQVFNVLASTTTNAEMKSIYSTSEIAIGNTIDTGYNAHIYSNINGTVTTEYTMLRIDGNSVYPTSIPDNAFKGIAIQALPTGSIAIQTDLGGRTIWGSGGAEYTQTVFDTYQVTGNDDKFILAEASADYTIDLVPANVVPAVMTGQSFTFTKTYQDGYTVTLDVGAGNLGGQSAERYYYLRNRDDSVTLRWGGLNYEIVSESINKLGTQLATYQFMALN